MNQFIQKLYPFSNWIGGGNVLQQAQESGVSFDLDITQQGFNTDQQMIQFATNLSVTVGLNNAFQNVFQSVIPQQALYIRGMLAIEAGGSVVLSNCRCKLTVYCIYPSQQATTWPPPTVPPTGVGETLAAVEFTVTPGIGFMNVIIPFLRIDRIIPAGTLQLVAQLQTERNLAAGEQLEFDIEIGARRALAQGMQILIP